MRKIVVLAFVLVAFFNGLEAKAPKIPKPKKTSEWIEPVKKATPEIYGNWVWFDTDCCGSRHGVSTPVSTNDNIKLVLNRDNTFREEHSKRNTLPRNGTFFIYKENTQDMVQFNDERPALFSISDNKDTLTLSWKYLELQTERFIKQK